MTEQELQKWGELEAQNLMSIGVDPLDAQRTTKWILDNLPEGEDPATWRPTAAQLEIPVDTPEVEADTLADWFAKDHVPVRFKRLISARRTE